MQTALSVKVAVEDIEVLTATKTRFWNDAQACRRRGEFAEAKESFRLSALFGRAEAVYRASLTGRGVAMIFGTQDYRTATADDESAPLMPPEVESAPTPRQEKQRQKFEAFAADKSPEQLQCMKTEATRKRGERRLAREQRLNKGARKNAM